MQKLIRLIRTELRSHPGFRLVIGHGRSGHHTIKYPGGKFCVQSSPRNTQHAVQVLRKQIKQIERGTHRCR